MASRAYLFQLIARVFGDMADQWLDTPNPQWPGSPKPRELVECSECNEMVETYLHTLSTSAAVERAQDHLAKGGV